MSTGTINHNQINGFFTLGEALEATQKRLDKVIATCLQETPELQIEVVRGEEGIKLVETHPMPRGVSVEKPVYGMKRKGQLMQITEAEVLGALPLAYRHLAKTSRTEEADQLARRVKQLEEAEHVRDYCLG